MTAHLLALGFSALLAQASGYYGSCSLVPSALAVDRFSDGHSNGNGVLEPGETAAVEPTWKRGFVCDPEQFRSCLFSLPPACRELMAAFTEAGTASSLIGPSWGNQVLGDPVAQYNFPGVPPGRPFGTSCSASQDCYALSVSTPIRRPVPHWDANFTEQLSGAHSFTTSWRVHVGNSFADVPATHPFYKTIETLLHHGVTRGCSGEAYCPGSTLTRSELAILLARALNGEDSVPASGSVGGLPFRCEAGGVSLFRDLAPTDPSCRHAHYLAARNVLEGCGLDTFCPSDPVSRLSMAAFTARAMVVPEGDAAILGIVEPYCSNGGGEPVIHFADVPASNQFCHHVHFLWARGVVAGCGPDQYCPAGLVTRDQAAKFLVKALSLQLYGR